MINLHRNTVNVLLKYRWRTTVDDMLIRLKSSAFRPTAGIIVIGDEVLKAQVKDINSFYACELLYKHGIKVEKISIVRDNLEDIAQELREFCKRFNYIFTSGGIGPTHDDVTYEAVALAFNDKLHYHPTLVDIIKDHFNCEPFPSPSYKMAYIPTKSLLKFAINNSTGQTFPYPCVIMKNVYIFPGSPMFFKISFQAVCKECFAGRKAFASTEIFLNAREELFASPLSAVAQECRNVSFGSYPEHNRYYKARVTIESEEEEETEAAKRMFCERIPANVVVHYDPVPHVDCLKKYEMLIESSQQRSLYDSSFKKFVNYYQRPEDVCVYLDGSEESILMIHFARIAVSKLRQYSKAKLHAFYFKSDLSTPNAMKFFRDLCDRYDVEICSLEYDKIDAICAINHLIVSKPELRVLLVGKRLNGNLREVYDNLTQLNDHCSVPVQVHFPLIDWSDKDITGFFSSLSLPYLAQETLFSL